MDFCPHCGNELPIIGGGAFCTNCGGRVVGARPDRAHDDTVTLPALRPAPGEPHPRTMTQIMPAVAAQVPEAGYDPAPLPPRVSRSVVLAVGVAVVAVAVVAVSLVTLDGGKKTPAAQVPPGQTEVVVTPTGAGTTAASANDEAVDPNSTSATSASSSTSAGPPPGPVTGVGSGRCVDIPGGNPVDGTQLVLFSCNNTAAQSWTYVGGTVQAMGKCLDVRGARSQDLAPIQISTCNGSAGQRWQYDPGTGELRTLGKCLDAAGAGTGDHTPLILYTCHQADNQRWHLAP
ncbi:MAG: ricin-type beta-trefoil lectin domain protein [Catenulispora sp.]|nr:ricin-type beta-trefoil lectin domain protein [Catenulispora sp.]